MGPVDSRHNVPRALRAFFQDGIRVTLGTTCRALKEGGPRPPEPLRKRGLNPPEPLIKGDCVPIIGCRY